MRVTLTFLGATGTVTGSRYLIEADGHRLLIDCGLFQGVKRIRARNWQPFPISPRSIDAVVLTDSHPYQSGFLPCLIREGYCGPVWCTHGTRELCKVLLIEQGASEEELARRLNDQAASKHQPAEPLFTVYEATQTLGHFRSVNFEQEIPSGPFALTFRSSGTDVGSSTLIVNVGGRTITFSGLVGREDDPLMKPPTPMSHTDFLILESTFGDRVHSNQDLLDSLGEVIQRTAARNGVTIFPARLAGRTQAILYLLAELKWQRRIPDLPVFVDSPAEANPANVYCKFHGETRLDQDLFRSIWSNVSHVHSLEDSEGLERHEPPFVIIAPTDSLESGRALHHLTHYGADPASTIILGSFQAEGTRGRSLLRGVEQIKAMGHYHPIRAETVGMSALSNHADHTELVRWAAGDALTPAQVFITRGEPGPADSLRRYLQDQLGWSTWAPEHMAQFEL